MRRLSQGLAELVSGGIVVIDPFPERSDEQVAFRTLIQLDGDVSLSIHAEALARDDFAALFARHQDHVREILGRHRNQLTWFARALTFGWSAATFILGFGGGSGSDGITVLLLKIPAGAMPVTIGVLVTLLLYPLAELLRRRILRSFAFVRPPLRE